jgi:hypothetical protein
VLQTWVEQFNQSILGVFKISIKGLAKVVPLDLKLHLKVLLDFFVSREERFLVLPEVLRVRLNFRNNTCYFSGLALYLLFRGPCGVDLLWDLNKALTRFLSTSVRLVMATLVRGLMMPRTLFIMIGLTMMFRVFPQIVVYWGSLRPEGGWVHLERWLLLPSFEHLR